MDFLQLFLAFVVFVVLMFVAYTKGIARGKFEVEEFDCPYVFLIEEEDGVFRAYTLVGQAFLAQSKDIKDLTDAVREKIPFFYHYVGLNAKELSVVKI